MTAQTTEALIASVLRSSPARYPELLVERDSGQRLDVTRVARLVASGLANRWSARTSVRHLVGQGEFGSAAALLEELVTSGDIEDDAADDLGRELSEARQDAVELIARRQYQLADRASQVGLAISTNEATAAAANRVPMARELLDRQQDAIDEAERRLSADIVHRASQYGVARAHPWRSHIQDLIEHREYRAALRALDAGPQNFSPALPLVVSDHRWPWDSADLAQVARWYRSDAFGLRPMGFVRFVPREGDADAQQLVAALLSLADGAADAPVLWLYAVVQLVGGTVVQDHADATGVARFSIGLPDDPRLPELPFVGRRRPYPIFVVTDPCEDSHDAVEWVIHLTTEIRTPKRAGHIVIDVSTILSLISADGDDVTSPRDTRRMRLLRFICSQVEAEKVVTSTTLEHSSDVRSDVWWLLYLLGFQPTLSQIDAVLELSGGHPRAVQLVVASEASRARAVIAPFDVSETRGDQSFQQAIEDVVRSELSTAAAAVLFAILAVDGDVHDTEDLRGALELINQEVVRQQSSLPAMLDAVIDLEAAIDELAGCGYLFRSNGGEKQEFTLCDCGVLQILKRWGPDRAAVEILYRLIQESRADFGRASDEELLRLADSHIRHGFGLLLDGLLFDREQRGFEAAARNARRVKEAWESDDGPVDVVQACRAVVRVVDVFDAVDTLQTFPDQAPKVLGSYPIFFLSVFNIVGNAIEAIRQSAAHSDEVGTVAISVTVLDKQPNIQIDVQDSGPGVSQSVRDCLGANGIPLSSKHSGPGKGIASAKHWLLSFGGELVLMPDPSPLGGAHFRIRLPGAAEA